MGILKKIGLKTAGAYCFYPIGKDSAVLVAVKIKKDGSVTVPERIGKYTVRGIDDPFCPGRIGDAFGSLDYKQKQSVRATLVHYQLLSEVPLRRLPATVEYIGHSKLYGTEYDTQTIEIPSHVRYIRSLALPSTAKTPTPILLPSTIRYLGEFSFGGAPYDTTHYYSLDFYEANNDAPPHLRLSDYFGREVSEEPRVADGAFAKLRDLMYLTLPKGITHIGAGAFARTVLYEISLPEGLTHIGAGAFADCPCLGKFNLPDSLTELAPDAFSGCPHLHLNPPLLEQLKKFPDVYEAIVAPWQKQIKHHLEEGDRYLYKKPLTILDKWYAYQSYATALKMDPFCLTAAYSLNQLFLIYQTPNGSLATRLEELAKSLAEQNSHDVCELLKSTLIMLDSVCVILSDPDEIITQRHVYGLNQDQTAATLLAEMLLDAVERHPKISSDTRNAIYEMAGSLLTAPTRKQTVESKKEFRKQLVHYRKVFGSDPDVLSFKHNFSILHPEDMANAFVAALTQPDDRGFYDAEFWLELIRTFNPKTEIPNSFKEMQARHRAKEEVEEWRARIRSLTFPSAPSFSMPSFSIPESSFEMSDVVSEYWASVAAKQEAAEIENMWGDLADIGFWDDTSWQ